MYVCLYVCVWYAQISMIPRIAWLNNLVVHVQYLCEGFASKRSSHTCRVLVCRYMLMYVFVYVFVYVCMYVCTFTMMSTSHTRTRTNMHARAPTCMHAHQHACTHIWSFMTALLIGTYLHVQTYIYMHAYVYIHIYTGLCDGLHDGDALTFGSRQPCAAVGSLGRCVYCTDHHCWQVVSTPTRVYVYVRTCMLLLGPLVAAYIAHCTHAHASSSRVRMCLCVCN
jgi:hypothetical protein